MINMISMIKAFKEMLNRGIEIAENMSSPSERLVRRTYVAGKTRSKRLFNYQTECPDNVVYL